MLSSILISKSCFPCSLIVFICFSSWFPIVLICLSNAFSRSEYTNLFLCIIWLGLKVKSFSPIWYLYLSVFTDDNADIFPTSLLTSYCSFTSLIFSSILHYYIFYSILKITLKGYLIAALHRLPRKNIVLWYFFVKLYKIFKVNTLQIINLLKLSPFNLICFGTEK